MSTTVVKLVVTRNALMMTAAVVSRRRAPLIRPSGSSSVSVAWPRICGMTATPVSKPERPRASFGKTSSAMPTTISGLPWDVVRASHQLSTATGWRMTSKIVVTTTMTFSPR